MPPQAPSRRAVAVYVCSVVLLVAGCIAIAALSRPGESPAPPKVVGTGRNDMPLRTFCALAPREPKAFTAFCELHDYYNYDFAGTNETNLSVRLRDRTGYTVHGYAERSGGLARRLVGLLRERGRWVTVEVQHVGRNPSCVALLRVVE